MLSGSTMNQISMLSQLDLDNPSPGLPRTRSAMLIRLLDIVVALFAMILLAPVLLGVAIAVAISSGAPVLFRHQRIGLHGRPFYCCKFRTMQKDAEERLRQLLESSEETRMLWLRDQKLQHDPRITPIGRFLRVSSLDELPQLWNVLVGDMSLVGPRPITDAESARYGRYFAYYIRVRPGITGLWQVSGRNGVSYRRRVAMDVAYTKSQSLGLYFKILLFTVPAVLLARGSS